ncbi:unnamed protein product [Ambrosiozyma monospora]|uniref:Unnamed protein product n=1 Tax=Ambrosiozyma monospora TaxID=43982 RepID=A0A9W6YUL8_AMBMO|nr:unnamed protein product [Ambrosiozyma monospora]
MLCYGQDTVYGTVPVTVTVPVIDTPSLQSVYISKKLSSFSKSWKSSVSLSSSINSSSSSSISDLSDSDSYSDADSESIFDHQHKKHQISSNANSNLTANDKHSQHSQHSDCITMSSILCSSHEPVLDGNHPLAYSDEEDDDDEVDENVDSLIFTPTSSVTPSPTLRHQRSSFSRFTSKISKFFERTASALDRLPDPYVFYNHIDTINRTTTRTNNNDISTCESKEIELTTFNEQDQYQNSTEESTTLPQFSTLNPFALGYPVDNQKDEDFPLVRQRQLRLNPTYLRMYAIDLSLREMGYLNVSDYELDIYADFLLHNTNEHDSNDYGHNDHQHHNNCLESDDTSYDSPSDEFSTSSSISSSNLILNSLMNPQTEADYDYQLQLRLSLISNHKLSYCYQLVPRNDSLPQFHSPYGITQFPTQGSIVYPKLNTDVQIDDNCTDLNNDINFDETSTTKSFLNLDDWKTYNHFQIKRHLNNVNRQRSNFKSLARDIQFTYKNTAPQGSRWASVVNAWD